MTHTYTDLEFAKVLEQIALRCESAPGRELSVQTAPMQDLNKIRRTLQLVSEFMDAHEHGYRFDFEPLSDLTPLFDDRPVLVFSYDEFLLIYHNCMLGNAIHAALSPLEQYKSLREMAKRLFPLNEITSRFVQIFDAEGEVQDNASSELKRIRKSISALRGRIMKTMQTLVQDTSLEKYLQDKFVTQRNDRYVLPVKENCGLMVKGIVQGQSAKGSTVFIEPEVVVPLSNELQMLIQEEKREIFRILSSFSADILAQKNQIVSNAKQLAVFDYRFACAKLGNELKAEVPQISEEPILELKQARHPLLYLKLRVRELVIPYELRLGEEHDLIILSGPNTGGKTVLLKATGLLTLMALSGLPIPASQQSVIGYFEPVYADIGDDQSIENALSAFSAHIAKAKRMLDNCNSRTLLLIDEIGSATDPAQGSALAQAFLEHFIYKGVKGLITTHYTTLKILGEKTPRCANASMQFDLSTMQPTYKFFFGFPGDSFAIEVAASLGIEDSLIQRAKELAGNQSMAFTEILKALQEEKRSLARASYEYQLKSRNLQARIDELEAKQALLDKDFKEQKKRLIKEMQNELTDQQKIILNELNELKTLDRESRKTRIGETLNKIQSKRETVDKDLRELTQTELKPAFSPKPGDRVFLSEFDTDAVILDIRGLEVTVDMNGITFKTSLDKLFEPREKAAAPIKKEKLPLGMTSVSASPQARLELKILGYTFDEAQPLIDEFIDNALMAGLHKLRIVHGKGTGALRSKVQSYLKRKKEVKDIATPPLEFGGSGVTVISV